MLSTQVLYGFTQDKKGSPEFYMDKKTGSVKPS
jgi:hypothetical protein